MSARSRKLRMEQMEGRQLMAADLFASMVGAAPIMNTTVQTAPATLQTTSQMSLVSLESSGVATSTSGSAAYEDGIVADGGDGVYEQPPSTYQPPVVKLINGNIHVTGTEFGDNVSISLKNGFYEVTANEVFRRFRPIDVHGGEIYFYGLEGNDTFSSDNASNLRVVAFGMEGDDTLTGGKMNDHLDGGAGVDHIYGMAGDDRIYTGINDAAWNYVEGGAGNDNIRGGNGMDFLNGNDGNDLIYGGLGEDYLRGGNGNDLLDGGTGDYSYNYLAGGNGNDELYGGWGVDYMVGNAGNDVLAGNAGNDILKGGTGCDRLFGGAGDDRLEGGIDGESDIMYGGPGVDTFVREQFFDWLGRAKGESIRDYEPGVDILS